VGQLSTSISHDVRQPLASLVLSSRAGLNWLACAQPNIDAARIAFERIQAAGQRASEILDRTKAFARKAQPSKEFVEINTIVADTVALIAPDARRRAIAVSADLTEGLAAPFSDRVQIQQVILNLAVNAMEAMDGPHEGPRQVVIRTWKSSEDAIGVGVCDTGPGVPQERRGRLFDAFYTTKPGGMGMGLTICRDIVEAHGGKLWMVPNEPEGAAFHLTLPLLSDRDGRLERGGATP
jgi:signal transduction histidine kinase